MGRAAQYNKSSLYSSLDSVYSSASGPGKGQAAGSTVHSTGTQTHEFDREDILRSGGKGKDRGSCTVERDLTYNTAFKGV